MLPVVVDHIRQYGHLEECFIILSFSTFICSIELCKSPYLREELHMNLVGLMA